MNIKTRCLLGLFVCCFACGLYAQQEGERTRIVHDLSKGERRQFTLKSKTRKQMQGG